MHMPLATDTQAQAQSKAQTALELPKRYRVILHNDDYTPMAFVVEVLKFFFHHSQERAEKLMMKVHQEGQAICGIYTKDIAQTIVGLVTDHAILNEYPLLCTMQVNDSEQ